MSNVRRLVSPLLRGVIRSERARWDTGNLRCLRSAVSAATPFSRSMKPKSQDLKPLRDLTLTLAVSEVLPTPHLLSLDHTTTTSLFPTLPYSTVSLCLSYTRLTAHMDTTTHTDSAYLSGTAPTQYLLSWSQPPGCVPVRARACTCDPTHMHTFEFTSMQAANFATHTHTHTHTHQIYKHASSQLQVGKHICIRLSSQACKQPTGWLQVGCVCAHTTHTHTHQI